MTFITLLLPLSLLAATGVELAAADGQSTPTPAPASTPASASWSHIVDLGHVLRETDPSWTGEKVFTHTTTGKPGSGDFYSGRFASDDPMETEADSRKRAAAGKRVARMVPVAYRYLTASSAFVTASTSAAFSFSAPASLARVAK